MRDDVRSVIDKIADPGDATAYAVALGALTDVLPAVSAVLSVVWLCLRIWESDTLRGLTGREKRGGLDQ